MKQAIMDAKVELVSEIKEKFTNSGSAVVVEYRGLTVAQVTELRRELRKEGVEFKVYKNSMVSRAANEAGYADLDAHLKGPNAVAFSKDAVAPSRILAKFAKKNPALVLKGAVVEGKVVNDEVIRELSNLPNKEGMLSMLLSCLQSPLIKFALTVKAVAEAKGGSSEAVVENAVEDAVVA